MAETQTPRMRATMSNRLLSSTRQFCLGSNDDQLERVRARAARVAAIRRKATATTSLRPPDDDPYLSQEQIIELFQNCIKLASENKINQKNTWELKLIDYLSEIIKVETVEGDAETNFQKASCTLEAGVKIYSVRVDAVHADACKVLVGISRAGLDDEPETGTAGEVENGQEGGHSMKESERKISPQSTLESSFEAFNIKKFDVAFAVGPLYHQTSAQIDEGGAKSLLLNNLGIYGACRILFDSLEVPGKCESYLLQNNTSDVIDISFAKELIEQMIMNILVKSEISPTLKEMICHFDKDNQRAQACSVHQQFDSNSDALDDGADTFDTNEVELDDSSFGNYEAWGCDHDEETSVVNESSSFSPAFHGLHEDNDFYAAYEPIDESFEDVTTFLFQGLGLNSKQSAWAGADYWKYQKFKGRVSAEDGSTAESRLAFHTEKQKKSQTEADINFMEALHVEMPDIFASPKNSKTLLLPVKRAPCNDTLPEDCHFQPETLVKLFLLPNLLCLGKRRRKHSDGSWQQNYDYAGALPLSDNESVLSGRYDEGCIFNDVGDLDGLVSLPHQIDKIEVEYNKTSNQVDVHVLKKALWDHIQGISELPGAVCKDTVSFRHALATFSVDCRAAALKDISPHLCFICLLHLANEHGLIIRDCLGLDDLSIHLTNAHQNTEKVVHDQS